MNHFAELHLKPAALARYGLPDIAYPVPLADVIAALDDRDLPLARLLHGLQQCSKDCAAPWRQSEPAMDRLAELLAPDDSREVIAAGGDDWWVEIGPVDLGARLVTIQRDHELLAAIRPRDDGRLRVAVFRPLDAKSAEYLIGLGHVPHPEFGVCMRENNWEYALDGTAGTGNYYAADAGEAYLSYWENGLGISRDGSEVPTWRKQLDLVPRPAARVVAELGVNYCLSGEADAVAAADTGTADAKGAPEPPAWRRKRQQRRTVQGRFLGCLLGGAVGDALGAPVEFMKRSEIVHRFGRKGITRYAPAYGGLGTITDDTQMTLFTAEGLIRGWVRERVAGTTDYPRAVAHAYLRWLQTQGERPACDLAVDAAGPGWLYQQRALHNLRAPGITCLSALRAMRSPGEPARNGSKGCGGVMRVAPVGLFAWRLRRGDALHDAFRLGCESAALTHGHPTGALPAGVLAVLILALTDGASLREALAAGKRRLRAEPYHEETLHAIERAEELADSGLPHEEAIARLGEGWVAEEALAISIYCALVARSFRHGVVLAVNHDGDSDSTGSIAGNLLGTMLGAKAIPAAWLAPLELREVIIELANDLYAFADWPVGANGDSDAPGQQIVRKYPGY